MQRSISSESTERYSLTHNLKKVQHNMIETLAKTGKKALTVAVVGTTIAWTTGVAAFVPMIAGAATLTDGDLIKGSGSAVYYYRGSDAKRCPFPNDKVFYSWFSDFKGVKTILDGELSVIGLCKTPMTYRSGTRLVKIATDPKVYAIELPNTLRHIADPATAEALFGKNWNKQIDDVPDVFFGNYEASDKQVTTATPPAGFVFKAADSEKMYLIEKTSAGAYNKREISDLDTLKKNGINPKDVRSVAATVLAPLPAGAAVAAAEKGLSTPQFAAPVAEKPADKPADKPVVAGALTVALDASSPVSGTLVTQAAAAGQLGAKLAVFALTNSGSAELKVTSLSLKRLGVSADGTLVSTYLYEGTQRLTDSASVSSGVISFNSSAGLFSIAGGATKKLWVGTNIAAATSGQIVGVGLLEAASIVTSPASTIAGTFPVNGNLMTIAQATLATVDFGAATPGASAIDPQKDYVMWQSTAAVGTRAVNLARMTFREIGSGEYKDINNFRLLVDGAQVGSPVAALDANGYMTFDLESTPKKLETGGRVIKVLADIVGGTSRTFSLSLRDVIDSKFVDVDYNPAAITPTAQGAAFSARTAGDQTINAGTLTMSKMTDSPSGNVVLTGSGVSLAKYSLAATGENMKVESLYIRVLVNAGAPANTTLRNGALYANGVQVGSNTATTAAAAGTQFSLGSALIVEPGKPVTLEVKADIFNSGTGTALAAADTLLTRIVSTANNVQRVKTGSYAQLPAADLDANILTIASGSLTLTKDQQYGNQNVVAPKQNVLLGQWSLTNAGSVEDININTLQVNFLFTDEFAPADLTNVYVKYGTKTGSTKSTIPTTTGATSDGNSWSINETLAKGSSMMMQVYGDIAAGAVVTEAAADNVTPSLLVSGTTAQSTATVTTNGNAVLAGQLTTARTSGVLTVSVDPTSPVAAQSIAGTTSDGGLKLRLSATREDLFVKDITFRADTQGHEVSISSMSLWQSTAVNGPWTQVNETKSLVLSNALAGGDNLPIPGWVRWTLGGDGRIKVAKDSTIYLLVKSNYVNSQQTPATAAWMPYIFLSNLQAEGSTGNLVGSSSAANLLMNAGLVLQANGSASYVDSTDTLNDATVATADTFFTVTNNVAFEHGDIVWVDFTNGASTYNGEELMIVLHDAGTVLNVARGAFGTTPVVHATASLINGSRIHRLSGTVATFANGGLVGSVQTVMPNKLTMAVSSTGFAHGSAQKVATITATAGTNASDPGQNNVTLTSVDLTVTKTASTINNVILYPATFDLNGAYVTNCVALSQTKWRCTLATTGSSNVVGEGSANVYNVYADLGYSGSGSVEFSIANLGTSNVATNDVSWSAVSGDNTAVALVWVNQGATQLKAGAQTANASTNNADATRPLVTSVALANKTGGVANTVEGGCTSLVLDAVANCDTITVVFNERIDPTSINANLVPGGLDILAVASGSTGGVTLAFGAANNVVTLTNILSFNYNAAAAAGAAATASTDLRLSAAGTTLTVYMNTMGGGAATGGAVAAGATTNVQTTVIDANGNLLNNASQPTPTGGL